MPVSTNNEAPFNIIVGPYEAWVANIGEAFPDPDAAPGGTWVKLGTNGSLEYDDDGVHVFPEQTLDFHRFLGSTGPRKATRSEEAMRVEFTLHDMSLEAWAKTMGQVVTTVAAVVGPPARPAMKTVPLYRGFVVQEYAFMLRGPSPYIAAGICQYQIPVAVIDGSPEIIYNKTDPAGLAISIQALEDPAAATAADRFGKLVAMTA